MDSDSCYRHIVRPRMVIVKQTPCIVKYHMPTSECQIHVRTSIYMCLSVYLYLSVHVVYTKTDR